ncbi:MULTISPECIES: heavy-metal-associated domain-containing protein [Capnocytophaga]|uniref:Heavy metal transport/detoxification protein n=1 Tax=Capnocytophaga canis TaxID=1848903 RepID=A0A0B7IC15_9FLAO|nr:MULTISPECIES: heavy metal-associated domain-containing protein [Capnocytophaga]ATA72636.1 heavy metal transporter [Capnocytophaga sp. H4358]ATA74747.1 heavy metal transporter [Capnocytophaga sp. H2931]RIY36323.1 heavy metal transporter [Capnocytophaga canis]CEN43304.1 Heavy metal transport/detoxification protein [Capnocytophaga canis]CEN47478.1 Heavy metal transport/detoxification protein [Capnocytophaga canis]
MKHEIVVENIKCGGCINSIKTALLKIEGVQEVHVDKETETVSVEGTVDKTILVKALSKLGYSEKGNNNFIQKAKSYVSCAMGKISD